MGEIRNAERTQKNILEAARKEFFEKGYKGARIEAIATSAGVKNQLIYHYFKGKAELLEAVLATFTTDEPEWVSRLPDHPLQIAEHRYKVNSQTRAEYVRFTAWESLDSHIGQTPWTKVREQALQSYAAYWKTQSEKGLLPSNLEPELMAVAITALTSYPVIFNDVIKMITGFESTDPEFQTKWADFLTKLSAYLLKENDSE